MKLNFGTFTLMDLKRLQSLTIAWLDQRIPNFFERHSYLSFKTSRPKPQKTHEKLTTLWMIFDNKLLSSFVMLAIYLLLKCLYRRTQRSKSKILSSSSACCFATYFLTLLHLCLGFDPYFGNHWARSTNQPLCWAAATFTAEPCW